MRRQHQSRVPAAAAAAGFVVTSLFVGPARADYGAWGGDASGNWSDASKWVDLFNPPSPVASAPTNGEYASIATQSTVSLDVAINGAGLTGMDLGASGAGTGATLQQAFVTVNYQTGPFVGYNPADTGTYWLQDGATVNALGVPLYQTAIFGNYGTGTLKLQSAGANAASWVSAGNMTFGLQSGSHGNLVQRNGEIIVGTDSVGRTVDFGQQPGATGTWDFTGGNAFIYGNLNVGNGGNGAVTQNGAGATLDLRAVNGSRGSIFLGNAAGATGTYTLSKGTATAAAIVVGGDLGNAGGTATFSIGDGASANSAAVANAGLLVWGGGTLNLNKGGTINAGSNPGDNVRNEGVINNNGGTLNLAGRIYGSGTINNSAGNIVMSTPTALDGGTLTNGGATTTAPGLTVAKSDGSTATFNVTGGTVNVNGVLGVGNNGSTTGGSGSGQVNVSGGTLYADTILEGSTTGGSGNVTINGTGEVTVGGGWSTNSVTVAGNGKLTVLDQNPPAGEDPVLNRAIVGGYLRDGALNVNGGTVTSPKIKLGITAGKTGTYAQTGGTVNVGILGAGNDADVSAGAGIGNVSVTGGTLNVGTVLMGSSAGGAGSMTIGGTGIVNVGGGILVDQTTVNPGGTLTVLDQDPPSGEDPVLNRAIVAGYTKDGVLTINGGTVKTPFVKLAIDGHIGQIVQSGGTLTVTRTDGSGIFGIGNAGNSTTGTGSGSYFPSGGGAVADNVIMGSTIGGIGYATLTGTASLTVNHDFTINRNSGIALSGVGPVTVGGTMVSGGNIVVNSGSLQVSQTLRVGSGWSATVNQSGGSVIASAATPADWALIVGDNNQAGYSLRNSAALQVNGDEVVGLGENPGLGNFSQDGGTHTVSGGMYIGFSPTAFGVFNLSAGTVNIGGGLTLGFDDAAYGGMNLSGTGSITSAGVFLGGKGSVAHTGGTNAAPFLDLDQPYTNFSTGYKITGGQLNLSGAPVLGSLRVGDARFGKLTIGDDSSSTAAVNIATDAYVAAGGTSNGIVTQNGGTVTIATPSGAQYSLLLGRVAGAQGTYLLHGGSLTINGNLQVGVGGTGTFTQDGSTAVAHATGRAFVGNATGSTGTMTVTAGQFTSDHGTFVGGDTSNPGGTGTLTIGDGSSANSTAVVNSGLVVWPSGTVNLNKGGTLNVGAGSGDNVRNEGHINNNGGTLLLGGRIYGAGFVVNAAGNIVMSSGTAIDTQDVAITGGTATGTGTVMVGKSTGSPGILNVSGGAVTINGTLGVGNAGTLTSGSGSGTLNVSGGTLYADTLIEGSTVGGSGNVTVSNSGVITIGGGFTSNSLNVIGGSVTVLDQDPPAGEDPVLNRAMVGGYLRDGAMNVSGGVVTTPNIKLGITAGKTGTLTQSDGTINVGTLGVGNDATASCGAGVGTVSLTGGTLNVATVVLGSTAGGTGSVSGTVALSASSAYLVQSGSASVGLGGAASLTKSGPGTVTLTGNNAYTGGTTVQAGKFVVNRLHENNAVNITGGTLQVADSTPTLPATPAGNNAFVSRPGSLTTPASFAIANNGAPLGSRVYNGTLDLGNNDLIIDYSGTTSPYADLQDMLRSGFSGGTWTGTGITSSTAANPLADNNYALGIAENGTLVTPFGDGTGINPQFSGQTVDSTTVLIKFTHRADLNLDGVITSNDAAVFNSSYQQGASGATWQTGDLNYNGVWDSNDAAIFNSFYNESLSHLPEPSSAAVMMLVLAPASVVYRRRRRLGV